MGDAKRQAERRAAMPSQPQQYSMYKQVLLLEVKMLYMLNNAPNGLQGTELKEATAIGRNLFKLGGFTLLYSIARSAPRYRKQFKNAWNCLGNWEGNEISKATFTNSREQKR